MKNAFDVLRNASRNNSSSLEPQLENITCKTEGLEKIPPKRRAKKEKEAVEVESDEDDIGLKLSPELMRTRRSPKAKRLRKRVSRAANYSDDNDEVQHSPKRCKNENFFSGKSFSLGDDESMLQPKPRKSVLHKSINQNGGVVPDLFKTMDQRRADKQQKNDSGLRQSTIVLPKSIASTTAKEIDRISGQVVELFTSSLFPEKTSVRQYTAALPECCHSKYNEISLSLTNVSLYSSETSPLFKTLVRLSPSTNLTVQLC